VDLVRPDPDLSQLTVQMGQTKPGPDLVGAIAICALPMPYPLPMATRQSQTTARDVTSPKEAVAVRPQTTAGWVFGGGALADGPGHEFIDALSPTPGLDAVYARVAVTARAPSALLNPLARAADDGAWSATVYAACIGSWY
jgi:hypothetical protein